MKPTNLEDLNILIIVASLIIAGWCVVRDWSER